MHFTVMQHIFKLKHLDIDVSAETGLSAHSAKRLALATGFTFGQAGKREFHL